ncbi:coiled-coil domain-containing protein [Oopsacas minuta]|uniref:Coiled-coil domain-containing protein n=1 Tax=Oopsacas minuta TaxID=111878 RepID=A0AAV7JRW8_9METZ|nr:coiled-coil domain-containing protein [Oopsacas minuta]
MSSIPNISLTNFLNEDCKDSRFVLTSPRSLQACKRVGVKPVDLLPRTLSQVMKDIYKHYETQEIYFLPTREHSEPVYETSTDACYAVWEELEKERCDRLELARRERDQIIIENYRNKKNKEQNSNLSLRRGKDDSTKFIRSDSSPNLQTSAGAVNAKPNARSLATRPISTREHRILSPDFSLTGTLMSRKGLVRIPEREKKGINTMLHQSVEEEYAQSLRHYWSSLWEKQRAQTVVDRTKREEIHQKNLASIRSAYELEENMSRRSREMDDRNRRNEKEKRMRESEDRHRAAMERRDRVKRQTLELSRSDRGVKKRLQEHRLRVSELKKQNDKHKLDTCLSESALKSEDNKQEYVLDKKQRAGYRNLVWEARSRLAQLHTRSAAERARELNKYKMEDKMGAAEIRQLTQRDSISSAYKAKREKECLKTFQQQLSLRQQEEGRDEWIQEQENKRREREGVAEVKLRDSLLTRTRSLNEKRRSRAESHQERISQVRENEFEWRRSVARELEGKEQRVSIRDKRRSLEARESKQIADMTELLRDTIKEQSGKKGFNEIVNSTELFHRLGNGPRGYQKNLSYSHLIS